MDRSPEKSALLSTKAHSLETKTASPRQQFAHEAVTTNAIFRPLKKAFPSQSTLENTSKTASFLGSDGGIGTNSEQFISSLQAQYYSSNVPSAALAGMSLPFGMIAGPGMDPRALNAGNLLYTYGNPVMSIPNFIPGYGQAQRVKNSDETAPPSDKIPSTSTQLRPTEQASRPSKEPMRTESVIKTVTDKQEMSRKPSDTDKRILTDVQSSNIPLRYPDKGTVNELRNSVEGKKGMSMRDPSIRDMQLRDSQSAEDMSRRDKQSIAGDLDRSRDMPIKVKPYEHFGVDSVGIKRPTNGLTSRTTENGAVGFSPYKKNFTTSESRSPPYPASEPPTLVPYHSTPPLRTSASTSYSNVPSTMPKLTPIAPRINNGSLLTVSYSSDADSRNSPSLGARRQNYSNVMNLASSAPSGTVHNAVIPWTMNYPSKPTQGDKMDETSRTKQNHREERDLNRTIVYDQGPRQQFTRNLYPVQPWERAPYGALPSQFRAVGADKGFGGKEDEHADPREVTRDSSSDVMSSEQSQAKLAKIGYKYGAGPVSVRKESDLPNTKIPSSGSPDEHQRNQLYAGRNEKSVVGEYVSYNKNDDVKGSLGSTVVHGKEGSFRLSVERREGGLKYLNPEITKPSRTEEHRATSGSYGNYDGRDPMDASYISVSRADVRSARDDKEKEGDRARPLEPSRAKNQVVQKEHAGRKLDPRDVTSLNDRKNSNDRNNNSTPLAAFPFFKYGNGGFPAASHGDQMRFVERGAGSDDKVFVPPNATIDMYERREQEMEKNAFKKSDLNAFSRNVEDSHSSNPNEEGSKKIDERRGVPRRDEAKPKMPSGRIENDKRDGDAEEISSDENDDGARHGSGETISPDKRVQHRVAQSSDRTAVSPAAGAVRQRRLSSPLSDQRTATAERRNPSAPNAYGAPHRPSLQSRRIPSDNSEGHSRESGVESGPEGVGNQGPAQFLRMDGGAFPSPYFGQLLTPQGLSEAPLLLLDPASFYGAMYRPPMMEAAPQGMFPSGALTADPVTGQIMMIPEAYIPMVAAENAFMNPMMDPRFHGMWGMPGAMDEAQWQQFYQMMQPFQQHHKQQQQQLLERSKQELHMGKQGAPFPLPPYPLYYGDKRFEQQRKEEVQEGKSSEQQQKAREVKQEISESQYKEPAAKPKPEATTNQEHVQRLPPSRDNEFVQQQETSNQREEKPKTDSRSLKEAHQKLTEKKNAVLAKLDIQGQMVKQFKDYLALDPLSQFPYPGPPTSFLRDTPTVNLTAPTTTTSTPTPQIDNKSVSPKTVSAAVTLSSLEKARAQEPQWTGKVSPPAKSDPRVASSQNGATERGSSPRVRHWVEPTIPKEIVETPRRLEVQPNLVGERLVSRESRDPPVSQVPLPYPQKLMAFGNIASERLLEEKSQRELERDRFEASLRAHERECTVSTKEMPRSGSEKVTADTFDGYIPRREHTQGLETYGEMVNSFVNSEIERTEKGLQPLQQVGLRESMESQEHLRGSFQTLIRPPEQIESDSEFGDDFRTECELRRIASSFVPLKPDLENKENSAMFSLRPFRSEAERKQIRDNIDRLRSMAKRRNSKDRFKVFSRRRDLRSPTTILNGVTSAIGDVAGVESVEKEMRMKLAELQKRYREKVRELARLQPKGDDGNGKSTPIKRGPGRPRKRKYFGAGTKGEKSSPVATADEDKEGIDILPASGAQSPELNTVASESESLIFKESEPPKKKKKRSKQKSPVEQEGRGTATPTLGLNPLELAVPSVKKKKIRKPSPVEEEPAGTISKSKPTNAKKKTVGSGKRRKDEAVEEQDSTKPQLSVETSAKELESDPDFVEPGNVSKNAKTKKPKPKKRARPKLTIDTADGYEGKEDDEVPLDNASEAPQPPTANKNKKTKGSKKKRKSTVTTPPKEKFHFPEVTSQDESFSENSSISPNEIAKEVVATAARKQLEAQKNSRDMSSENEDDVFSPSHDGRDGLSLLAQASFATTDKATKRKRTELVPLPEDLSLKKRGRPKKDNESPLFEPDAPVTPPKKKKKKKIQEEDTTKEPKKKKKKKKKVAAQKDEITDEKRMETQQEVETEPSPPPPPPPPEEHEEVQIKESEPSAVNEDSEQDEDVFSPAFEVSKDVRTTHSNTGIPHDGGDSKTGISSLLSDEWQPRRSERIFINSSVTTNSSSSPLSPSGKGSEFSYTKKAKKGPGAKVKTSRSGSQGEEELVESDVIVPQKVKSKAKKKRGPGKAKKRIPSDEDYEPLKVSRRVRSKSRLTIEYDDADEEDGDEPQENEEPREEGETDMEINVTDKVETAEEKAEDEALPVEDKKETDLQPEAEEKKSETEVKVDQRVVEMEVDEKVEATNDGEETGKTATVEESKEDEEGSAEEVAKKEEKTEQEQASQERSSSPVDVRYTFLVGELVESTKLLVPVDSVFYPGRISTFNEPDLFGVVLDGERGRRPHWKSTEQLLTEAVKDIQPPGNKFLSIGTRVCAHWSPQYRCFYPGTVTEAPADEKEVNGKIWIEFDDGDSGFFQLNEIRRIHPDFPAEEVESTPSLPEKRPRSSSLGATAPKHMSSRLRAEENTCEFSSGNESSGEIQSKRRRLRGKRKSRDDSWLPSKRMNHDDRESSAKKGDATRSKPKEVEKSSTENTRSVTKIRDKSIDSHENKVLDTQTKQKTSKLRGKVELNVDSKESSKTTENTKSDLVSNASVELKESEKEIHSSDSSLKTEAFGNRSKQSSDKLRASALDASTESDQGEDSEANSDVDTSKSERGTRSGGKGSSRTSEKDLRRRSLTLNLNSSFRSSRTDGESPTRDVVSTSQDEDSESYSDAFDESPVVENKPFQPRLGRRRRSELDRLQVDMKYSGPLWQWSGRNFQNKRKGKGKKVFYKAIVRGDETISVGDCAVFMSNPTKHLNLPYVGKIESMWEGCGGNMVVRVKWFYHPEETKPGRKPSDGKQSLYRSTHVDENDVQTISHKCEVLSPEEFKRRFQNLESPGTRTSLSDRVFCCIGSYDPNNETLQAEL